MDPPDIRIGTPPPNNPPVPATPPPKKTPRIPPFTPRTPMKINRDIADMDTDKPFSEMLLASGCSIIIRGVGANKRNSDTEQIVRDAIAKIRKEDPALTDIPAIVKPYPNRGEWTTSCYVSLCPSISTNDAEPRTDLLSMWMSAFSQFDPKWEIAWTPAKSGTDRRMWIRFPDLTQSLVDQDKARAKILKWANDKGYLTCGSYNTEKGGVQINLASPHHVDDLASRGKITIPGFDYPLRAVRIRQIEVQNALELIITGVPTDYENMDRVLQKWLFAKFQSDGQHTIAGSRIPPNEPESIVFHMLTWADTTKVLDKEYQEMFKVDFAQYGPSLSPPQILVHVNSVGVFKALGSIRKEVKQGAAVIEGGIAEMKRDLARQMADVVRDNQQQHLATQLQLTNINSGLNNVIQHVANLEDRMMTTQRAILAQSIEVGLSRNLSDNANDLLNLEMRLLFEHDPVKCGKLETMVDKLRSRRVEIQTKMESSNQEFLAIVQGPGLGQIHGANPTTEPLLTAMTTPGVAAPTNTAPTTTPSAPPGLSNTNKAVTIGVRRTSGAMTGTGEAHNDANKRRRIENSSQADSMDVEVTSPTMPL